MRIVGRGARAVEDALLKELDRHLDESERDPTLLNRPVVVVVPSRSLKSHLSAALVRHRGRAAAGVTIQTLFSLAFEICERGGQDIRLSRALFELLVRREAPAEPVLAQELGHLDDGYGATVGSIRDLFDAGFAPDRARALDTLLVRCGVGSERERERARALIRVAAAVGREMTAQGFASRSALLEAARDLLAQARDAERRMPARTVLIHGFADATGAATRLLAALVQHRPTTVLLDHPPDPADPEREDPGIAFGERFRDELQRVAAKTDGSVVAPVVAASRLTMVRAPGPHAEAREVAGRIRRLLGAGVVPERIGVVARDLEPFHLPIRVHFDRLGVPFSALAAGAPAGAAGRAAAALADLLERDGEVSAGRWLDARAVGPSAELRIALAVMGISTLAETARVEVAGWLNRDGNFQLPVRLGLASDEEEIDDDHAQSGAGTLGNGTVRAVARTLEGRALRDCVDAARHLLDRMQRWPEKAPASEHFSRLARLLSEELRWTAAQPGHAEALAVFADLQAELPANLALSMRELLPLLLPPLRAAGQAPLGGTGGGVAVLGVIEARGRTFDHLFVMGLNRDRFPRAVHEDPLLPDDLRRVLSERLPALAGKRQSGFDEEHFLFAELLSSAPEVTLSWSWTDDDGKPATSSALIERVRLANADHIVEEAPHTLALASDAVDSARMLNADERATHAGLTGGHGGLATVLAATLSANLGGDRSALARARLAVLDEIDPELNTREGRERHAQLGPYFGFVGGIARPDGGHASHGGRDPRRTTLYVTALEGLARCSWQHLVGRLLRVEALPDPLAALPAITAREVGILVHSVLQRIVKESRAGQAQPKKLVEALRDGAIAVSWPDPGQFELWLREEAVIVLRKSGIGLPGLARVLMDLARPRLEVAGAIDWPEGHSVPVVGAELEAEIAIMDVNGVPRTVRFRADRVDTIGDQLRLVDYKTGKVAHEQKKPKVRRDHYLEDVRAGRLLQAVVYAQVKPGAAGRFLFLPPDAESDVREVVVAADDGEFSAALGDAGRVLLNAWDRGAFLPRFIDTAGRKDPRCDNCEVALACLRGDSGTRKRLQHNLDRLAEQRRKGEAVSELEAAFSDLAMLGE